MLGRLSKLGFGFAQTTELQMNYLESLKGMRFNSDTDLFQNIRDVYRGREYIVQCSALQDCIYRAETYMLKKAPCSATVLGCYYKLQQMRLVSPGLKHDLVRKYHDHLVTADSIPPAAVQKYLWFLYEQSRFERHLFIDAAETHTLGMLSLHQQMNEMKTIPKWEPYLRVVNMLKYLGHEVSLHSKLPLKQTLAQVDHFYFPFLTDLYSREEMERIRQQMKYDEPFLSYVSMECLNRNNIQYDAYLHRVEEVEHEVHHQRQLDIMSLHDFPPILHMIKRHSEIVGMDHDLQYGVTQLFFRLCEKADLDLENVASILGELFDNPNFLGKRRFPVVQRCLDSLNHRNLDEFRFFSAAGFVRLLEVSRRVENKAEKEEMQKLLCRKVLSKAVWDEGDKELIVSCVSQGTVSGGEKLLKKLELSDF